MGKALVEFEKHLNKKKLQKATIESYLRGVALLLKYVEEDDLPALTEADVRKLIEKMDGTKDEKGVTHMVAVSRTFFNYLIERDICTANPMENIHFEKPEKPTYVPTRADVERMMEGQDTQTFFGIRNKAILALICNSRVKIAELMTLRVQDADLANKQLVLKNSKIIDLDEKTVQVLSNYLTHIFLYYKANSKTPLFINWKGQLLTRVTYWKIVKDSAEQVGITEEVNPITLRNAMGQ